MDDTSLCHAYNEPPAPKRQRRSTEPEDSFCLATKTNWDALIAIADRAAAASAEVSEDGASETSPEERIGRPHPRLANLPFVRTVIDGVVSPEVCRDLVFALKATCTWGYRPHVVSSTIHDVVATAPWLLPTLVRARQAVLGAVEAAFGLSLELGVEFSGLIGWTAGASLGWHHDANRPYLSSRHLSAVLYLNDQGADFGAGDFRFQDGPPPLRVAPQAGRLVAYTADARNVHCVDPVSWGERCTLTLWFSLDPGAAEDGKVLEQLQLNPHLRPGGHPRATHRHHHHHCHHHHEEGQPTPRQQQLLQEAGPRQQQLQHPHRQAETEEEQREHHHRCCCCCCFPPPSSSPSSSACCHTRPSCLCCCWWRGLGRGLPDSMYTRLPLQQQQPAGRQGPSSGGQQGGGCSGGTQGTMDGGGGGLRGGGDGGGGDESGGGTPSGRAADGGRGGGGGGGMAMTGAVDIRLERLRQLGLYIVLDPDLHRGATHATSSAAGSAGGAGDLPTATATCTTCTAATNPGAKPICCCCCCSSDPKADGRCGCAAGGDPGRKLAGVGAVWVGAEDEMLPTGGAAAGATRCCPGDKDHESQVAGPEPRSSPPDGAPPLPLTSPPGIAPEASDAAAAADTATAAALPSSLSSSLPPPPPPPRAPLLRFCGGLTAVVTAAVFAAERLGAGRLRAVGQVAGEARALEALVEGRMEELRGRMPEWIALGSLLSEG